MIAGTQNINPAMMPSTIPALPFGRLWYGEPDAASNAVDYAKFRSRSHDAVIRVYDDAGKHARRTSTPASFASSEVRTTATARPSAIRFI